MPNDSGNKATPSGMGREHKRAARIAAVVFAAATAGVVAFQAALALGAPWGSFAMGGAYPGVFPPALRVAAVVQGALLVLIALVVLSRAGLPPRRWARASTRLIWLAVGFSTLSLLLNLITPSSGERAIWAPVAAVLLIGSLTVALAGPKLPAE